MILNLFFSRWDGIAYKLNGDEVGINEPIFKENGILLSPAVTNLMP